MFRYMSNNQQCLVNFIPCYLESNVDNSCLAFVHMLFDLRIVIIVLISSFFLEFETIFDPLIMQGVISEQVSVV